MRTAKSILKKRLLVAMGWTVEHLPIYEWMQCSTHERRLLYCFSFWDQILASHGARVADLKDFAEALAEVQRDQYFKTTLPYSSGVRTRFIGVRIQID